MRTAHVRLLLALAAVTALAATTACEPLTKPAASSSAASSTPSSDSATSGTTRGGGSGDGGDSAQHTVPDVVGKRLSDAEDALKAAGYAHVSPVDDTGRDRIVIDPENWVVDTQKPGAGTKAATSTTITLDVKRPSDGGSTSTTVGVIPDVVCMNLQDAQNTMQDAGFFNLGSADGTGKGRMQILDRDWVVIGQTPKAGTKPGLTTRVVLTAVKYGESTGSSGCRS